LKRTFLGFAALAAIIIGFGFAQTQVDAGPSSNPDLRVAVACNPLTNSQAVVPGDTQLCRMKFANYSGYPIENITIARPSVNTLTDRYAYNSPTLDCDIAGCAPFTLAPGQIVYVFEEMEFKAAQDGRGRTKATATGTQVIVRPGKATIYDPVVSFGYENKSLP
jgi:hypothetical protein